MTLGDVFILLIETRLKLEREYAKPDRNEREIVLLKQHIEQLKQTIGFA
jgi:hypothetical protein